MLAATLLRALAAEALGTCLFIFVGAGAIVTDRMTNGGLGLVGIALAHGLALAVMVSAFGGISGGHFNPAVTVGVWIAGKIPTRDGIAYIIAQLVGAVVAGIALLTAFRPEWWGPVHLGTPTLGVALGVGQLRGTAVEALLTMMLVLVVFLTAVDEAAPRSIAGFGIGLTLAFDILVGGPLTGAAANPARAFGPALASGHWDFHYIYWIGPLVGGIIAAVLYRYVFSSEARRPG